MNFCVHLNLEKSTFLKLKLSVNWSLHKHIIHSVALQVNKAIRKLYIYTTVLKLTKVHFFKGKVDITKCLSEYLG